MKREKPLRTVMWEIMETRKLEPVVSDVTKIEIPAWRSVCFIGRRKSRHVRLRKVALEAASFRGVGVGESSLDGVFGESAFDEVFIESFFFGVFSS